jgi:hypothetical protein
MKIKSLNKTLTENFKDCHEKLLEKKENWRWALFRDVVYHVYRKNLEHKYICIVSLEEVLQLQKHITECDTVLQLLRTVTPGLVSLEFSLT